MASGSETEEYNALLAFAKKVTEVAQRSNGFVSQRGSHGYHILFNETEMAPYFNEIRNRLARGQAGRCLMNALASGVINADSSNHQIWCVLVQSLQFSGIDFEHLYKILPSEPGEEVAPTGVWEYVFEESIVLGHSLLVVPVMQQYGPLVPKLDLKGPTQKFEKAQPLLAVGMVGDCVKGTFFDDIKQQAEKGDEVARQQRDALLNPERLQQKMRGLVRALLLACRESGECGLMVDAVLVGSGAFGGSAKVLAQPFADSLNGGDLAFDNAKDEVNFFMFPPPKQPEELTLEPMKYKVSLNPKKGLGNTSETASNVVRVVVAGFDPISLTPHGVLNRAFSAEGQLCHATDLLQRVTSTPGKFVRVQVPKGNAWESPAAFFAKPQELKVKDEEAYDTVRFVPLSMLEAVGVKEGQEADIQLVANEKVPPRVWNGDSFDGWVLSLKDARLTSWKEALKSDRTANK